jgi:2-polyprenyl-3-methyl-5-hydroxy-6-metoxy-1,4-benzoquinol methylase
MITCPLCQAGGSRVRETIQTAVICDLYHQRFSMDVSYLFSNIECVLFCECATCGLFYFSPPVTGDSEFYDKLQNEPWYYLESKYEYEFVANLIDRGASVLDVGSGKGAFAARLVSGVKYIGLDLNIEAGRKARSNGVDVMNESIETHSLSNRESYDFVVSFQSLEHVANPHSFLAAAATCIRPSGKLVIVVPSEDSFLKYASNSPLNMPPHHVTRWSDGTLRNLAKLLGLNLGFVHHEPLQDMHSEWGFSVMAHAMLGLGRHQIVSQTSLFGKVRSRIAGVLAGLLHRYLSKEFWPCGHSVIAVYTK